MIASLEAPYDHLRIHADSEVEKQLRVPLCSKEPETIAFLLSIPARETLYDVGACVGGYSILAASLGINVYAFEPAPFNIERIMANARLNDLSIPVYPVAIGERIGSVNFDWSSTDPGSASHTMIVERYINGSIPMLPLDFFPAPDHIKCDVDGSELKVVRGAEKTLTKVKSIQIEIDDSIDGWEEIPELLMEAGLTEVKWTRHFDTAISNVLYARELT